MTSTALGATQVNSTDYDGKIVIEKFSYWHFDGEPHWAEPAWEETCWPELAGPFASLGEAESALASFRAQVSA